MVIGLISGCMITGDNYILLVNFLYINFFIKINIHFILQKIFIGNIGFSSNSVTFYVSSYLILLTDMECIHSVLHRLWCYLPRVQIPKPWHHNCVMLKLVSDKEPTCQCRRHKRRSSGGGHGNPLAVFLLKNPRDRGAWQATVHRVSKSRAWLKQLSMHPL